MIQTRRSSQGRRERQKAKSRHVRTQRRWLQPERLEERMMLAGNVNPWHNIADPLDVNDDTSLTPLDALIVVNNLNQYGTGRLGQSLAAIVHSGSAEGEAGLAVSGSSAILAPEAKVDVDNDNYLTPIDALRVINALNAGEGETTMVRASVRMTTNVPVRDDRIPVLDYVPASPPTDYQSRQDILTVKPYNTILLNVFVEDTRKYDGIVNNPDNLVPPPPEDANNDGVDDTDEFGIFAAYFDVTYDPDAFTVPPGASSHPIKDDPNFPISFVNPKHQQFFGRVATEPGELHEWPLLGREEHAGAD